MSRFGYFPSPLTELLCVFVQNVQYHRCVRRVHTLLTAFNL